MSEDIHASPCKYGTIYRQVHVGYDRPWKYVLTPSRKSIGKAVARGSTKAVAEALSKPVTQKYVLEKVGTVIRSELATMCSDKVSSMLHSQSTEAMKEFTWA